MSRFVQEGLDRIRLDLNDPRRYGFALADCLRMVAETERLREENERLNHQLASLAEYSEAAKADLREENQRLCALLASRDATVEKLGNRAKRMAVIVRAAELLVHAEDSPYDELHDEQCEDVRDDLMRATREWLATESIAPNPTSTPTPTEGSGTGEA